MKSFNSFKTFEALYQENIFLKEKRFESQKFYAHTHAHKDDEDLIEHITLVTDYALNLIKVHHLEPVVHRLLQPVLELKPIASTEEVGNFIKKLFINTIIYHDFGKINESFQSCRMHNPNFRPNRANTIGNQHSILSVFLYISTHLSEIYHSSEFNEETKAILYVLTYLFSIPILKHHSPFLTSDLDFPEELIEALNPYLHKIGAQIEYDLIQQFFYDSDSKIEEITDSCLPEEFHFPLYILLKLCYSLLTAADYQATSAFMMDLTINDFGVLQRERIESFSLKFQSTKSYNKLFFEQRDFFHDFSKKALAKCSPENINILRQKLLDEVLLEICNNPDQDIFYLEAPTGSGKTNISIAATLELLKINSEINKIYYVFPFTTLITQTAKTIRKALDLSADQMIQLHSRSGFTPKRNEEQDGAEHLNYIDYLFLNYPITLLTHVKFFDILKGNSKEPNYIFHRLANSVVIIDELQSYPPREWDKIAYFIRQYAHYFKIKFILMSATLPKLDNLEVIKVPLDFHPLLRNKKDYFQNANFKGRVEFDFSLLDQKIDLEKLSAFMLQKCNQYAMSHAGKVKSIIEFIYKKSASDFFKAIYPEAKAAGYNVLLLSGTILEPRRKEIIELIKSEKKQKNTDKILLISTQVVEAGVDIDMDIGFKDQSLIDSDEQLAGRVNRNARPDPAKVYIFNLDPAFRIYGDDLRYRITRESISQAEYQSILANKDFDFLYKKVCQRINAENSNEFMRNFNDYKSKIKRFDFFKINTEFKIIDQQNATIYVPLEIPAQHFSDDDKKFMRELQCYDNEPVVDGENIWYRYLDIIQARNMDFIKKKIELKKIYGIMSQFMFSIYFHSKLLKQLLRFCDKGYYEKFNILYLSEWQDVYDYKTGINDEKFDEAAFF